MEIDEYIESLMKTEKKPKFPQSMYYSEGAKYLNRFQYEKALESLDKAVALDSTDFKSLLKRAKCYIALRKYNEAIEDAQKVLNIYPDNVQAIDLKGQAQYLMGDFEGGYLTYLEGRKLKPISDELRLGKQLCEEALDKSLNPRYKMKFDKRDVVNIYNAGKIDDTKFQKQLKIRRSNFKVDARFMEELMRDESLVSVHGFCEEALDFIKDRDRFMCMETPLHIQKKEKKISTKEKKTTLDTAKYIRVCNASKRRMEIYLEKGRISDCITEGINFLNLIEWIPQERQIEKMKLKCDAFHLMSLAYRQGENKTLASRYLRQELEIATEFNLIPQLMKAYHQLGQRHQFSGDITRAVLCLNKVVNILDPEKIDELISQGASPAEIRQIKEAHEWANRFIATIMVSLRESIIAPVVHTFHAYYSAQKKDDTFAKEQKLQVKDSEHSEKQSVVEEDSDKSQMTIDDKSTSDESSEPDDKSKSEKSSKPRRGWRRFFFF